LQIPFKGGKMEKFHGEHWDSILSILAGVPQDSLIKKKAQSCPNCGGKDRYEYLGVNRHVFPTDVGNTVNRHTGFYDGSYMCRGCGAGDGYSMLIKLTGMNFSDARISVMKFLGIEPPKNTFIDFNVLTPEIVTEDLSFTDIDHHPYMIRKKIISSDLPNKSVGIYKDRLAIPIYECVDFEDLLLCQKIKTYELISNDSKKLSLKGYTRKNGFFRIGSPYKNKRIYVAEGFSTAYGIHKLTGEPSFCSFGVMNVLNVVKLLTDYRGVEDKDFRIVIVCDNDPAGEQLVANSYAYHRDNFINGLSCIMPKQKNTDFGDIYAENPDAKLNHVLDKIDVRFTF
jgi:putative DNA primase/helicase